MEAFRNGIVAVVILIGLLCAWSFVSADDVGVFINGHRVVCDCPACTCPSCQCAGECRCEDCQGKKTAVSFPNGDAGKAGLTKPIEIVLVTAEEWCRPCQLLAPHWSAVSANDPVCRTLDVSDPDSEASKEARKLGVSKVPTLVRLVNGRVERTSLVGGLDREGLWATVERWKEARR